MKRPLTCVNLIKAIGVISAGQDPMRLSRAMANVIVAQMLPAVVASGSDRVAVLGGALRVGAEQPPRQ